MWFIIGFIGTALIILTMIYHIKTLVEKDQDQQKRSFHDIKEMVDRIRMDKKYKNIEKLEENTYEEDISDIDKLNNIIK